MRKLIRTLARIGQGSDVWPIVSLLIAVVVPAVCLLWFMSAAMRNERFAVRQKLAEAYRSQLSASQARLEQYCNQTAAELQELAQITPASAAFAKCIQSKDVDSVIIYDQQGHILYPNTPWAFQTSSSEPERKWAEASKFEYQRNDFIAAAKLYDALAKEATNANVAARAFHTKIGRASCRERV